LTFSEKLKHQDKRIDDTERQVNNLTKRVDQMAVDLAQLIERDKNKELLFRQFLEIERLKLENEMLKSGRTLPPAQTSEIQP
jgi:hypothetical protein